MVKGVTAGGKGTTFHVTRAAGDKAGAKDYAGPDALKAADPDAFTLYDAAAKKADAGELKGDETMTGPAGAGGGGGQ